MSVRGYVQIARVDHWFKNVLVLPGTILAALLTDASLDGALQRLVVGLAATCAIASANYALNEWLDADFDRFHPIKCHRPSVTGGLARRWVWMEYAALLAVGLGLASTLSPFFLTVAVTFALMGVVYNVEPIRSKDRVFVDALSESFNNPLRLLLGWFVVTDWPLPPVSLLLGYWMAGAFLMAVKRFAELRFLGSGEIAGQYRRSFRYYTEESAIISALFYACCSSFFLGVFLVKYRVELILTLPFLAVAFAWYLHIGLRADSPAQRPEHLYRERAFAAYLAFLGVLLVVAFVIDVPPLRWFLIRVLEVGS